MQKIKIMKIIIFVILVILVAVGAFLLLTYHSGQIDDLEFSDRQEQRFSQEILYQGLNDFELLDSGVIRSTSDDPWILLYINPDMPGYILTIDISNLSIAPHTVAQIFYAYENESFSEENSIHFGLRNGLNNVRLPSSGYSMLRLDLTNSADVSMRVNEVILTDSFVTPNDLPNQSWVYYAISAAILCVALIYVFLFHYSYVKRLLQHTGRIIAQTGRLIKGLLDGIAVYLKMVAKTPDHILYSIFYLIASGLVPGIFILFLYNNNDRSRNTLFFEHILILTGILAAASVVLFLLFRLLSKSNLGGLVTCVLFWAGFWHFEALHDTMLRVMPFLSSALLLVVMFALLLIIAIIFRKFQAADTKRLVPNLLAINLVGLFIFNLIPGVSHEMVLRRGGAMAFGAEDAPYYIKENFFVDHTLPMPDIYWFHADGMVSLETAEEFFSGEGRVCYDTIRTEFEQRGFQIYPNAELNAGYTTSALIALLSPAFYDSLFGNLLDAGHNRGNYLARLGLTYDYLSQKYELLTALTQRGYLIEGIYSSISVDEYIATHFADAGILLRILARTGDLPQLLNDTTPLNITPINERRELAISNLERENAERPQFTWIGYYYTHIGMVFEFDPDITVEDVRWVRRTAVHVYDLAYEYMAYRLLAHIDAIYERNPNAVIIVQSDHGIHLDETIEFLRQIGYSEEDIRELRFSLFSAARIPEMYGGLDAPIAPLNMARELVNRFVGQNYRLR